jgi:hypothetical protein
MAAIAHLEWVPTGVEFLAFPQSSEWYLMSTAPAHTERTPRG